MFNADEFLSSSNEAVLDTQINQLDEGEYDAQIGVDDKALVIEKGTATDKNGEPKDWAQLNIRFEILDPTGAIKEKLKRDPAITYRFFLDLTDDGKFDFSPQKNVRVGQLLKACGKLQPGWRLTDLKGQRIRIKVAKRKGQDGVPRSEVVMVGNG